jgi:hypothetical protein
MESDAGFFVGGAQSLPNLFSLRSAATILALLISHRVLLMLYRISPFHPLAKFPGPKLAAATYMYEFWFDGVKWGKYNHEIQRLHQIHGKGTLHAPPGVTLRACAVPCV